VTVARDARGAAPELSALVDELWRAHGLDYRGWSADLVEARARARAALEGLADLDALRARLLDDRACLARLVADLASGPIGPFADPPFARALRGELCARLRTYPSIRVWHPACGTGEEVWATAIVLREEGLLGRARIYATEANDGLLDQARRGAIRGGWDAACARYAAGGGASALAEYFRPEAGGGAVVRDDLRDRIVFGIHSLASDASINEFHLIVCRDVLGRFGPTLRTRAIQVIDASLARLGFLALGPDAAASLGAARDRFEAVRWAGDLYRKVG
jgi:chemotaxis protein methyltransferase CheR